MLFIPFDSRSFGCTPPPSVKFFSRLYWSIMSSVEVGACASLSKSLTLSLGMLPLRLKVLFFSLMWVNPASMWHDLVMLVTSSSFAVLYKSSCWTWHCVDAVPVCKFRTKFVFLACLGYVLRLGPILDLGSHLGVYLFGCRLLSRAGARQPKMCMVFNDGDTGTPLNLSIGDVPLFYLEDCFLWVSHTLRNTVIDEWKYPPFLCRM